MSATTECSFAVSLRNGHGGCILCGDRNPASLKLQFVAGAGGAVNAKFKSHAGLQGYDGILHGGVIAALLDSAMTHCLFRHGIQGITGELRVRYLHPVAFDATLDIQSRMILSRPPLYVMNAEILEGGCVMACAEAKFMDRAAVQ